VLSVQREVEKLHTALEEARQQNKELQERLTRRTHESRLDEQQRQEIQDARSRFAAKRHCAKQGKAGCAERGALNNCATPEHDQVFYSSDTRCLVLFLQISY
jgi:hypothetical protein